VVQTICTDDPSLLHAFNSQFELPPPTTMESEVLKNIPKLYHSIPKSSPTRSSLINELFAGVSSTDVSELLGISIRAVNLSRAREVPSMAYYIRNMEFPREKIVEAKRNVLDWFNEYCVVPSGRSKRYYLGTNLAAYSEYIAWASRLDYQTVSYSYFRKYR